MVSKIPASFERRSVREAAQRVGVPQALPAWRKQGLVAYTDGACLENPGGPAGWSALLWAASDVVPGRIWSGALALACFGHIPQSPTTTNNRAEISAVLAVLSVVAPELPLTIHSDSQYIINVAQGKWEMKKNADLWKWYHDLIARRKTAPIFHWVQGHAGYDQNVMADHLADIAARNGAAAAYERWQADFQEAQNGMLSLEVEQLRTQLVEKEAEIIRLQTLLDASSSTKKGQQP